MFVNVYYYKSPITFYAVNPFLLLNSSFLYKEILVNVPENLMLLNKTRKSSEKQTNK